MSASGWPPLGDGEILLDAADELLWRICAEAHWDVEMEQPSTRMFRPTDDDGGKLSTSRGSKATPQEAIEHRARVSGKGCVGAWSLAVEDVEIARLRAVDDSAVQPAEAPPGHTYVDFRAHFGMSKSERERLRQRLLLMALERPKFVV